jgi:hypothetical protein
MPTRDKSKLAVPELVVLGHRFVLVEHEAHICQQHILREFAYGLPLGPSIRVNRPVGGKPHIVAVGKNRD